MVLFSDGPRAKVSRVVSADAAALWPLITDVTLPVAGSAELQRTVWEEGSERVAEGAVFIGHNTRGDAEWQTRCVVTSVEEDRGYSYAVWAGEHQVASWNFELQPDGESTRVTQAVLLGPGRSGLTWAIRQNPDQEEAIVDARLSMFVKSMERNMDEIEKRAVSSTPTT